LLIACYNNPRTLEKYACEGEDMYVSCGEKVIHVVDANYGRLDNSMCADQLGTPNDNCRSDVTCIARKWFALNCCLPLAIDNESCTVGMRQPAWQRLVM